MNKKTYYYIPVAFITAALLAAVIFVVSGIYPGSERTLLIFDMKEQFVSFYSYMSRVRHLSELKYTFEGSLGTPLAGLIAYYLASPLSFVYLFFDVSHLPDAIVLVDILKAGLLAASFAFFAISRGVKEPVKILSLSVCYALSSAAVTLFILPMYLDTLFWLPLIAVSMEQLYKNEGFRRSIKYALIYSLLLFLCILTHYYSAYMVCLFLILYAVYIPVERKMPLKKACFGYCRFAMYSLIGSAIAGLIMLPVIRELIKGKAYDAGVYSDGSFIVTGPFDLLKQFLCGSFGGLYSEGSPSVYCTLIMLGLSVYYLVKKKQKSLAVVSSIIFGIFIMSFMLRPMYRIWHMFRDPVAYPHRFSFLFVFFVMVLATEGVKEIKCKLRIQQILLLIISVLLVINGSRQITMELKTLPSATLSDYRIFIDTTSDLVEAAEAHSLTAAEGLSLSRISKDYEFTSSDCMLLGYNGPDYFSSSYDPDMLRLYKNLGLLQYHYKACDEGTTILTDMFLGIDYMIHKGHADHGYEFLTSNGFATLSANPYSLGIGYMISGLISGPDPVFGKNPFVNQNLFVGRITGLDDYPLERLDYDEVIKTVPGLSSDIGADGKPLIRDLIKREITFTAPAGKNIYLNFELLNESELDYETKSDSDMIIVSVDDHVIAVFTGYQKAYNIRLGNFDTDKEITVVIEGTDDYREAFLYTLDLEKLDEIYSQLNRSRFIITEMKADRIEGTVAACENGQTLLLTIPYSSDIEVLVDGLKTDTERFAGSLLSVPGIEAGEHSIEIRL